MNAIRPVAVKLDQDTRDRLKRLADAKDRSTHWMLREAVAQFVDREEKREAFRQVSSGLGRISGHRPARHP